jgi:hypothetical protein
MRYGRKKGARNLPCTISVLAGLTFPTERAEGGAKETIVDVNQLGELEVLCRAQSFLDLNADALRALNEAPARGELDALIQSVRGWGAEQQRAGAAAESQTVQKNELHARLRHELGRLRAIAEARPKDIPNLQKFKPLSRNTNDTSLRLYAVGMADGAEPYKAVFAREGFGEDFVDRLRAIIAEFTFMVALRSSSQQRRFLAARSIENDLKKAWKMISLLAALFEPGNADHERLQAAWKPETLHAPRALPGPRELPRLAAGEETPMLALAAGDAPAPGTNLVTVADQPALPESGRRGLLRLIGRLFGSDRAA